jgi:hypothetical protein
MLAHRAFGSVVRQQCGDQPSNRAQKTPESSAIPGSTFDAADQISDQDAEWDTDEQDLHDRTSTGLPFPN